MKGAQTHRDSKFFFPIEAYLEPEKQGGGGFHTFLA